MKIRTIAIFLLLLPIVLFAQEKIAGSDCEKKLSNVEKVFETYKSLSIEKSAYFLDAAREAEEIIKSCNLDSNIKNALHIKQLILEMQGYTILDYYEYKLLLTPIEKKNFFSKKIEILLRATGASLSDAYIYQTIGKYYAYIEKDYTAAEKYYQMALSKNDKWVVLLEDAGWNYMMLGKSEAGDSIINKCLELKPDSYSARLTRGHIYGDRKNLSKALDCFKKLSHDYPAQRSVYVAFGYWYSNLNQHDSAIFYAGKAIEIDPLYIQAYLNLAAYYRERNEVGDQEKALALYDKCIAINDRQPVYYKEKANTYIEMGKADSSFKIFSKAVKLDSSNLGYIGTYFYNKNNYKEAVKNYTELLKFRNEQWVHYNIGLCYKEVKDYAKAIYYYKKVLELDPGYESVFSELAYVYSQLHKSDSTLSIAYIDTSCYYYKKVILKNPQSSYIVTIGYELHKLANASLKKGGYNDAYNYYLQGAKLGNDGCKYAASGLRYEFGFDGDMPDFKKSKYWYKQAARKAPVMKVGWAGLVRLYESGKIPMDSADHEIWRTLHNSSMNEYSVPGIDKNNKPVKNNIYIYTMYPQDVNPMEWEAERIANDYKEYISDDIIDYVEKTYALSKTKHKSYTAFLDSILNKPSSRLSESEIQTDSLTKAFREKNISYEDFNKLLSVQINKLGPSEKNLGTFTIANTLKKAITPDNIILPDSIKLVFARKSIDVFDNLLLWLAPDDTLKTQIADACGGFSYAIILLKDYAYGLKAAKLAHTANPKEIYAKTNLPLSYLLTNDYKEAERLYLKFKDEVQLFGDEKKTYKQVFFEDFKDLESKGIWHPDFNKIKQMLNQQIQL